MTIDEKEKLSMLDDMGLRATAIRLRAAIHTTGLSQKALAELIGIKRTALNNAAAGMVYPAREVLRYLYRAHRLDFNFMLNGNFSQLPSEVQDLIFPALEAAAREWDQKEG